MFLDTLNARCQVCCGSQARGVREGERELWRDLGGEFEAQRGGGEMSDVVSVVVLSVTGVVLVGLVGAIGYYGVKGMVDDVRNTSFVVRNMTRKVRNADGQVVCGDDDDSWSGDDGLEMGREEAEEELVEKVPTKVELWQALVARNREARGAAKEAAGGQVTPPGTGYMGPQPLLWTHGTSPVRCANPPGSVRAVGRYARSDNLVDSPSQTRLLGRRALAIEAAKAAAQAAQAVQAAAQAADDAAEEARRAVLPPRVGWRYVQLHHLVDSPLQTRLKGRRAPEGNGGAEADATAEAEAEAALQPAAPAPTVTWTGEAMPPVVMPGTSSWRMEHAQMEFSRLDRSPMKRWERAVPPVAPAEDGVD